jgi:hypothetical protein
MPQYINNTTLFDTYGSNITYNFDYIAFTNDTLNQRTVSINNATDLSEKTKHRNLRCNKDARRIAETGK